jgi:CheY-like chemotaxis protein
VLYVDDNPANLELVQKVIDSMDDVMMIGVHTAELGISMAEELRPGLILMDINLPGLNAIEALQELRRRDAIRATRNSRRSSDSRRNE